MEKEAFAEKDYNIMIELLNELVYKVEHKDQLDKIEIVVKKILKEGKIVGGIVQKHIEKVESSWHNYLNNSSDELFSAFLDNCLTLRNDLWEL